MFITILTGLLGFYIGGFLGSIGLVALLYFIVIANFN